MRGLRWILALAVVFSLGGCMTMAGAHSPLGSVMLLPCSKQVTVQNNTGWTVQVYEGNHLMGEAKSGDFTAFTVPFYQCGGFQTLLVRAISSSGVVGGHALRVYSSSTYNPVSSDVFTVNARGSSGDQLWISR